jgi:glucose-1-phosphate thymidylyltransferase
MKGIILAGGSGTRLYPLTKVVSKQLQPVYDKPMIYYPLSILMLGGIRDILIITNPGDLDSFVTLLGNGSQFGINIQYKTQESPNGLPEAFIIGEDFIANDDVTLILGDNLFYGDIRFFRNAVKAQLEKTDTFTGRVFAYYVADPSLYGVVEFDKSTGKVKTIEEKPVNPKSNYAIPGLYIFDSSVSKRAKALRPSNRGETEIVELIKSYLNDGQLGVEMITRGVAWLDTGSPRSLLEASEFIGAIEARQGLKVACLEEVALRMSFISRDDLLKNIEGIPNSEYKQYLKKLSSIADYIL